MNSRHVNPNQPLSHPGPRCSWPARPSSRSATQTYPRRRSRRRRRCWSSTTRCRARTHSTGCTRGHSSSSQYWWRHVCDAAQVRARGVPASRHGGRPQARARQSVHGLPLHFHHDANQGSAASFALFISRRRAPSALDCTRSRCHIACTIASPITPQPSTDTFQKMSRRLLQYTEEPRYTPPHLEPVQYFLSNFFAECADGRSFCLCITSHAASAGVQSQQGALHTCILPHPIQLQHAVLLPL